MTDRNAQKQRERLDSDVRRAFELDRQRQDEERFRSKKDACL
jgi:hypothetical protein